MDELKLQDSISRKLVKERPPFRKGMTMILDRLRTTPQGKVWDRCRDIRWSDALDGFVTWFDSLLAKHPPPRTVQLLWFSVSLPINPASTAVYAFDELGPGLDEGGDHSVSWPINKRGDALPGGTHPLVQVEECLRRVGLRDQAIDPEHADLWSSTNVFCYCSHLLLVLHGLQASAILKRVDAPRGLGAVCSWHDGDFDRVGLLTKRGWKPFTRRAAGQPKEHPGQFDPNSPYFNLKLYVESGRDLEVRNKFGETLLLQSRYTDAAETLLLLDHGASVHAVTPRGVSVLHTHAATDIRIFRRLLDAKPDVNHVSNFGMSVFDQVIFDDDCTLKHVELLEEAGAKLSMYLGPAITPLHVIGTKGLYERSRVRAIREMLDHWLSRGYDMGARDAQGRSPLWCALVAHAEDLENRLRILKKIGEPCYGPDSRDDEVAILLLEHGADPNQVYAPGKPRFIPPGGTPLMVRFYKNAKLVKALLEYGADPFARCAKGRTALDYAKVDAKNPRRIDRAGAAAVVRVLETAMKRAGGSRGRRRP